MTSAIDNINVRRQLSPVVSDEGEKHQLLPLFQLCITCFQHSSAKGFSFIKKLHPTTLHRQKCFLEILQSQCCLPFNDCPVVAQQSMMSSRYVNTDWPQINAGGWVLVKHGS